MSVYGAKLAGVRDVIRAFYECYSPFELHSLEIRGLAK